MLTCGRQILPPPPPLTHRPDISRTTGRISTQKTSFDAPWRELSDYDHKFGFLPKEGSRGAKKAKIRVFLYGHCVDVFPPILMGKGVFGF